MSLTSSLDRLQNKLGAGCGTRGPASAAALRDHISGLLHGLTGAGGLQGIERRLRRADQLEAAFFELVTADLLRRAGADIVDFLQPPGPDLCATFPNCGGGIYVEVTSLAFADAMRPGRHFVSDDATDAMIAQRDSGVHTLQAVLREQGCSGSSLVSRLRGTILEKIDQLPSGQRGIVAVVRPLGQQLFSEWVFSLALWGDESDAIYEGQTRRVQVPIWGRCSQDSSTGLDAVVVLTPSMGFAGIQVPQSPAEWQFLTTTFMLARSLPQPITDQLRSARVAQITAPR